MEILNLTPQEFYREIRNGKFVGQGANGVTLFISEKFIKIHKKIYSLTMKNNKYSNWKYKFEKEIEKGNGLFDRIYIEDLSAKQDEFSQYKFPTGIIDVDSYAIATILQFLNEYDVMDLKARDYQKLVQIFRNIFTGIKRLGEYDIFPKDIVGNRRPNIMCQGTNIQFVDFESKDYIIDDSCYEYDRIGHQYDVYRDFLELIRMYRRLFLKGTTLEIANIYRDQFLNKDFINPGCLDESLQMLEENITK